MTKLHKLTDQFVYPLWVEFSDPTNFDRAFDEHLLPLAKALRLCSAEATASSLLSDDLTDQSFPDSVRGFALKLFVACAALAERCKSQYKESSKEEYLRSAQLFAAWFSECHGYLMALRQVALETSRRGAEGRRLIGAATRDKVRREALRVMRPGFSKEQAAPEIAQAVKRSTGTVRKLLSEIFPGELWS